MKRQQMMEELEQSIDDKVEMAQVLEGQLGFILSSTQVSLSLARSLLRACMHAGTLEPDHSQTGLAILVIW